MGVLTELRTQQTGIGELRLLMPVLVPLSQKARVLWVAPPYKPYAPALAAHGMDLDHLLVVRPKTHGEALWTVSQGLLSPSIAIVVGWFTGMRENEFRALARQASEGGRLSFCFLPDDRVSRPSRLRLVLQSTASGIRIIPTRKAARPLAPFVVAP